MAGEGIQLQVVPHQRVEAIETEPHIARTQTQVDAHARGKMDHRRSMSSTRRSVAVGNSEAIAAGKYYFKAGSAGSDLFFGFEQCKSYRLILLQPLPPAIKGIRLNAVLLAERGHALPARFLLTYQLVPIVPPGLPHIFKCGTSGDELGRAVHEPLTRSLRRTLSSYCAYYLYWRTHLSLHKDAPKT